MSNLTDIVSGANLYNGKNYSFKADRFGNIQSYQAWSRIIDFGNGKPSDNVVLYFYDTSPYIAESICSSTICDGINTASSIKFQLNKWYHVAFVLNETIGSIYVNGILAINCTNFAPNNVQRTNNYIGKSNWGYPNANAIYDEIKIYQGAMSQANVVNDYSYSSSKLIF